MFNLFKKKVSINVWLIPILVIGIMTLTLISVFWGMHKLTHNAGGTLQFLYTLGKIRSSYVGEYTDKKLFEGVYGQKAVRGRHARPGGRPGRSLFRISG